MTTCDQGPVLHIVATPLGNLSDMSPRALRILSDVDLIACEDTRRTGMLLRHLEIDSRPRLISYYDANESDRAEKLVETILQQQLRAALICDAGTPAVSDPGYRLVAAAHRCQLPVSPIPGPSAALALLSASGLPSDRFHFVGFLSTKHLERRRAIESWSRLDGSVICFESPRRCVRLVEEVFECYPSARLCLGKELTKVYEVVKTGDRDEIMAWLGCQSSPLKGEWAIVIWPNATKAEQVDLRPVIAKLREAGLGARSIADALSLMDGVARKDIYKEALNCSEVKDQT